MSFLVGELVRHILARSLLVEAPCAVGDLLVGLATLHGSKYAMVTATPESSRRRYRT